MINNTYALIGVNDIIQHFMLSPNTDEAEVKRHILDAQEFDLGAILGEDLFNAIHDAARENIAAYNRNKTYSVGDKCFLNGRYFLNLTGNNSTPPSSDWGNYELMNFFYDFVKKYLAGAAMVRYYPFLGIHATQWGLEQYNQEGFGQVTDKRRGEMLNAVKSKKEVFSKRMINRLNDVNYTFDGVKYKAESCVARRRLSTSVIGAGTKNNNII